MLTSEHNKMMKSEDVKKKDLGSDEYFFPDHQVTIVATSREEAEKKLKDLLKEKK